MYTYILYFNYYSIFIKCVLDSMTAFLFIKTIIRYTISSGFSKRLLLLYQYIHRSAQNLKGSITDLIHLSTVLC